MLTGCSGHLPVDHMPSHIECEWHLRLSLSVCMEGWGQASVLCVLWLSILFLSEVWPLTESGVYQPLKTRWLASPSALPVPAFPILRLWHHTCFCVDTDDLNSEPCVTCTYQLHSFPGFQCTFWKLQSNLLYEYIFYLITTYTEISSVWLLIVSHNNNIPKINALR